MNHKNIIIFAVILLLLCFALVFGLKEGSNQTASVQEKSSSPIAGISIGGPYNLTDHTGQPRTDADFKDVYKLIYFGFTYCPAICPTELQKVSSALNLLPEQTALKVQPLFITIDPQRDTQEVMKDYTSLFHSRLIGLTGTQEQINHITKSYRVYAKKVQDETLSDYTMDHSSYIYLMSPDDQLINIYRTADTPQKIAEDIKALIL